jgi:hypothetical protein
VNRLRQLASDPDERDVAIVPDPDEPVRAAILRALAGTAAPDVPPGWATAALLEGVGADDED